MKFVAEWIHGVDRDMGGDMVLHGDCSPCVQRKCHFRRIGEIKWDAPSLDQSSVNVAPFDIEKPMTRCRFIEAIDELDRLLAFDCLR